MRIDGTENKDEIASKVEENYGDDHIEGTVQVDRIMGDRGSDTTKDLGGNDVIYNERRRYRPVRDFGVQTDIDGSLELGEVANVGASEEEVPSVEPTYCDWIPGSEWNDRIRGQCGKDTLTGGVGNDRISGGLGDDSLRRGLGHDHLIENDAADTVFAVDGMADKLCVDDADTLFKYPKDVIECA